ncbi:MAG: WecB/TagA/CpsF family glycosyltransferase [Chitinophagales bacterium]|nr:WecB/TagA/CpsF family glycosyltransferase [Chitinophagales bacterium]MBP9705258.1 WecB/TagA/CpsF family glycosyltransferase [Chitinophagales bacterium]
MLKRTRIFDLELINDNSFDAVLNSMLHFHEEFPQSENKLPLLFTPNVDDVVKLNQKKYADVAKRLQQSYYILPDGQPIIWASKILDKPLAKRLPGSELFPLLWKLLTIHNKRILLVAPSEKVGQMLKQEYPTLEYYVPPFFEAEDTVALQKITSDLLMLCNTFKPEYIFIGIRFPKQNYIAFELLDNLQKQGYSKSEMPLCLLLGASYEFYLDIKKRAPAIWQKTGMEWFYRFTQEPGRLFKRYFIDDMQFVSIFMKEYFKKESK